MSKMIFVEGKVKESDKSRAPIQSETYHAKKYIEEMKKKESEETNDK